MAIHELGNVSVKDMMPFVMLLQSALSTDDKKKVVGVTNGSFAYVQVQNAMRQLSSKILTAGSEKKKVYPVNFAEEDGDETILMAASRT